MKDLNRMMFVEIGQRSNCIIGLDQIFLRVACSCHGKETSMLILICFNQYLFDELTWRI